jgi:flagellar biosynthetic protein FliR
MTFTAAQITSFVGSYYWPFVRIGAMLMVAPVFGAHKIVPVRIRLGITLVLTALIAPLLPSPPAVDPLSAQGILITVNQLLLGFGMGFVLQLVFSTLVFGASSISMTMGLGFASFIDPQNGMQAPVVSTLYTIIGTLLFLALNGHLVAIQILIASFKAMPVGPIGLSRGSMMALTLWAGRMFIGALLIALPALITIMLINMAFGVMTRAAPQLNIFAVGFPTTMAAGFVIMVLTLPSLLPRFTELLMDAFDMMQKLAVAGA